MQTEQIVWRASFGWRPAELGGLGHAQLVLVFGGRSALETPGLIDSVRHAYTDAQIVGCSTAGEIDDEHVSDDSLVVTAVHFDHSCVRCAAVPIEKDSNSEAAGRMLASQLD